MSQQETVAKVKWILVCRYTGKDFVIKNNAEDAQSEKDSVVLYSWANGILEKGFQH